MQDIKLNLEEFEELVQPQPPGTGPCINIHSSGNISLNAKLLEKLHTRELRVLVSHDREMCIRDRGNDEPGYQPVKRKSQHHIGQRCCR